MMRRPSSGLSSSALRGGPSKKLPPQLFTAARRLRRRIEQTTGSPHFTTPY